MTIDTMRNLDRESVTVYEAASVIGCSPQRLRDALDVDEERPVDKRRFMFPHCKIGNERHIMRSGFLRWVDGAMILPDAPADADADLMKAIGATVEMKGADAN